MRQRQSVCWVLTQSWPYEGEGLFGAYASKEDAERAIENSGKNHYQGKWCIYEVELGAPARWYGFDDRERNKDDD